jgi:hypothetical protein
MSHSVLELFVRQGTFAATGFRQLLGDFIQAVFQTEVAKRLLWCSIPPACLSCQAEELRAKKLAKRAAWDKGYAEGGAAAAAAAASAVDAGGAAAAGAGSDADVSDEDEGEYGDAQQRICSFAVPAFQ